MDVCCCITGAVSFAFKISFNVPAISLRILVDASLVSDTTSLATVFSFKVIKCFVSLLTFFEISLIVQFIFSHFSSICFSNGESVSTISTSTSAASSDVFFATCETHRLSNFLHILLQPYAKYVKSYIKDTKDFLEKLPNKIDKKSILVPFDVENLYSNIPHKLGLTAISFWLNKYPNELPNRIRKDFILEGIKLILENNSFCFNDTYFLQTKGTAIGTKFAPIYATLVLAYLEETMYIQSEIEFDSDFQTFLESNFKRYLDDCFLIFTRTEQELEKFHTFLNTLHPSINFTIDKSKTCLPFLDTLIINHNGQLQSDIFYKPTDSKQYLLYTSCHPNIHETAYYTI